MRRPANRAADVLDQRSHNEIGAGLGRLARFDQLAVAVIDEHRRCRRRALDSRGGALTLSNVNDGRGA